MASKELENLIEAGTAAIEGRTEEGRRLALRRVLEEWADAGQAGDFDALVAALDEAGEPWRRIERTHEQQQQRARDLEELGATPAAPPAERPWLDHADLALRIAGAYPRTEENGEQVVRADSPLPLLLSGLVGVLDQIDRTIASTLGRIGEAIGTVELGAGDRLLLRSPTMLSEATVARIRSAFAANGIDAVVLEELEVAGVVRSPDVREVPERLIDPTDRSRLRCGHGVENYLAPRVGGGSSCRACLDDLPFAESVQGGEGGLS